MYHFQLYSTANLKRVMVKEHTLYQQQYHEGQRGPDSRGHYPDNRLTPAETILPERTLPHLDGRNPALISPDGRMVLYDESSMAVQYQEVLDALLIEEQLEGETDRQYESRQRKGRLLQETMAGKHLEQDFKLISTALGFLMDRVSSIAQNKDEYFSLPLRPGQTEEDRRVAYRNELRDQLYINKEHFFPAAMQALSDAEMSGLVTGQHGGRDPLLHICEAMASMAISIGLYQKKSDTFTQIDIDMVSLELSAIMLHDFGKLHDPKDPTHAAGSIFWADKWIQGIAKKLITDIPDHVVATLPPEVQVNHKLAKTEKEEKAGFFIRFLIKYHDLGGFISAGKLTMQEALKWIVSEKYIPSREAMYALEAIQDADMDAIPGMKPQFVLENRASLQELAMRLDRFKTKMGLQDDLFVLSESAKVVTDEDIAALLSVMALSEIPSDEDDTQVGTP